MTDSPEAPDSCQRISLKIGGMTCAACAANVQKALSRVEGVSEAAVNIATEQAAVLYDPEKAAKSQLEQAVKDLEDFVAGHPDIPVSRWDPILLFDGYRITLTEESAEMAGFVESYPVAGIYQLAVDPEGTEARPD